MEQHLIQKRQFKKKMNNRPLKKKMNFDFLDEEPKKMEIEEKTEKKEDMILGIRMSESMKDYVVRSYSKCKRNKKNERIMTKLLKEVIEEAKELGDVAFRDWDNYPLPLLPYERIKKNQVNFNNNPNLDYRGNPFLQNQQQQEMMNYGLNQAVYENIQNSFNSNSNDNTNDEYTSPFNRNIKKKKKQKIDYLISKEEQDNLREVLRRQGKNKKIPMNQRNKYIDVEKYLTQVKSSINVDDANAQMILDSKLKIVGTSQALEKKYFRLTELPDPSTVRPEPVLKRSMKHVMMRYKNGEVDDRFVLDQFRSIRLVSFLRFIVNF